MPFSFGQSDCATTTTGARSSLAPPSSFDNASLHSAGGYQSSFYPDSFAPSTYTIVERNLTTASDGNVSGYDNPLTTLHELDTFQQNLASTGWSIDTGYQEQRNLPTPAFTGGSLIHHDAVVQREAPALVLPEAAYTNSPFVPQSTSAAPSLVDAGSALTISTSQPQQRRSRTTGSRAGQQKGERLNCTQPDCTATFGRGVEFRRHMRTVHQEQGSYRCLVESCNYQYARADKVRSHMEKVHGLRLERT